MSDIYWSVDEEFFNADCLEELLTANTELGEGDVVCYGEAVPKKATNYTGGMAVEVAYLLGEHARCDVGEVAYDYPLVTKEQLDELQQTINTWAEKHCTPTFFGVKNIKEYTITRQDLIKVYGEDYDEDN